jgi:peroxiredoxin (alkyl hydroperoxide reductase subunit C)
MSTTTLENMTYTPMPRIGDTAPSFEAVSTQGQVKFPVTIKGNG